MMSELCSQTLPLVAKLNANLTKSKFAEEVLYNMMALSNILHVVHINFRLISFPLFDSDGAYRKAVIGIVEVRVCHDDE